MFNSVVLDVVIGLIFIFLLYSLLATIIQELIATMIGMRSRILLKGIRRMLDDEGGTANISTAFYNHPLIKYLGGKRWQKKPPYMSAQNFSKVMIDLLRGKNVNLDENIATHIQKALDEANIKWGDKATKIETETLSYLKSIWIDAQGDVEKYKLLLEQWFDDTMQCASTWYKKQVKLILFIIGFSLAIIFNINTIAIVKKLSTNPKLAEQLVSNATVFINTHKELAVELQAKKDRAQANAATNDTTANTDSTKQLHPVKLSNTQLDSINEYILTQSTKLMDSANAMIQTDIKNSNELLGLGWRNSKDEFSVSDHFYGSSIIGWLITALAISLGAPFWFDLLSKLMSVRGAEKVADKKKVP
jgi:hypothetical protein